MRKIWFVTGAARGIGAGIAKAALAAGDSVVATDRDAASLRDTYPEASERILLLPVDITDMESIDYAVKAAMGTFGRIDVLVNNAGYGQFGPFEEISADAVHRQFATNVFGTFNVTRRVLPIMRVQRSGHIVNMSSNGGFKGVAGASMYSATKFAIEGFSESLALEVAEFGVKLTIVEPGAFRTDFLDKRSLKRSTDEIDDYAGYRARANAVFEARNHNQVGDPDKLGQALLRLVDEKEPPLRFAAGADAVKVVHDKLQDVSRELERWRALSVSTNFSAST